MATGNRVLIEVGLTTEQLVAAVRRMPPSVRRRILEALAGSDEAVSGAGPASRRPRGRRERPDDFLAALQAAAGILEVSEDPVRWQRRIRSEWDDRWAIGGARRPNQTR